jgi:hypothetical protein
VSGFSPYPLSKPRASDARGRRQLVGQSKNPASGTVAWSSVIILTTIVLVWSLLGVLWMAVVGE